MEQGATAEGSARESVGKTRETISPEKKIEKESREERVNESESMSQ